jgi:hypothetical protein
METTPNPIRAPSSGENPDHKAKQHRPTSHGGEGRVCFRGDIGDSMLNRDPEIIFKTGFKRRDQKRPISSPGMDYVAIHVAKRHIPYYNEMDTTRQVVYTKEEALAKYNNLNIATSEGVKDLRQEKGSYHVALLPRVTDIETPTAVCVTPRFSMAVLFPPKMSRTSRNTPAATWVYAVFVRSYHNTNTCQSAEGLKAIRELYAVHARIASNELVYRSPLAGPQVIDTYAENAGLWPVYAQELATTQIDPQDVICAVKVHRDWGDGDWTHGCDYDIWKASLQVNPHCTVDKEIIELVVQFIQNEPKQGRTPSRSSGFYKDTNAERTSIHLG